MREEFQVEGMHCTSCEKIIANAVKEIDGVKKFEIDYVTQKARVEYDDEKTNLQKIISAVEKEGYAARELSPNKGVRINVKTLKTSTKIRTQPKRKSGIVGPCLSDLSHHLATRSQHPRQQIFLLTEVAFLTLGYDLQ